MSSHKLIAASLAFSSLALPAQVNQFIQLGLTATVSVPNKGVILALTIKNTGTETLRYTSGWYRTRMLDASGRDVSNREDGSQANSSFGQLIVQEEGLPGTSRETRLLWKPAPDYIIKGAYTVQVCKRFGAGEELCSPFASFIA